MPPLADIAAIEVTLGKPIIVCDCDEVLLHFVRGLETYLGLQSLYLELTSFRLMGNIKKLASREALADDDVRALLRRFFESETHKLIPVEGAAQALAGLALRAQIVVLSNVPLAQKEIRAQHLASHGMPYPVIANEGLKGDAVAALSARAQAPVFFLDDIPAQISSVAQSCPPARRIHFVADTRLRALVPSAADAHFSCEDWPQIRSYIERTLDNKL